MRASDADRERAVAALRDSYSDGRLTEPELSARVHDAYDAQTVGELEALTGDLPGAVVPAEPAARRVVTRGGRALRASFRIHATTYVAVNAMLVAIWALTGGGYFWPVWSMLGWGVGLVGHYAPIAAGAGTRRVRDRPRNALGAAGVRDVAASVDAERPSLRSAAAPDGTVTIMFSDIVGSTALNERLGDVRWLELLREHHAIVREQVGAHGGYEVKVQGDGFMVAFPGARRAVECARAIQAAIGSRLASHPDAPMQVRIGLHSGEALKEQDDFYGRNVVLAARIAASANGGEILASDVVRQLSDSGGDIGFVDARDAVLDGLAGTHRLYRVV